MLEKRKEKTGMGLGDYVIAEWKSTQKLDTNYQMTLRRKEDEFIALLEKNWGKTFSRGLTPKGDNQFTRTTIMPELFDDHGGTPMTTWRQAFTSIGHMTIINGVGAGNIIPEDWGVLWTGLAFPNKNQHLTEIKMQIGDRKYGRINLEEMHQYDVPILIFEEPFAIEEETAFDLYGYIEGELPHNGPGGALDTLYQRIVMTGCAFPKMIDRALGAVGAAISST